MDARRHEDLQGERPGKENFGLARVLGLILILALWSCGGEEKEPVSGDNNPAARPQAAADGTLYRAAEVRDGGVISGKVLFKGPWGPVTIPVTKDGEVCGKTKTDPSLLVSPAGELQNAVVYIVDVKKGKAMTPKKVTLDQKGCEYRPHILAFPAGSSVDILNSDGILHNIHSYSKVNSVFNIAQPKFKKTLTVEIEKPEIINVKCDVHGWMSGWFFVAENPYFTVTDNSGSFQLTDVPPGTYTLELWHETLGKVSQKVMVKPKEKVKVDFELSKRQHGAT